MKELLKDFAVAAPIGAALSVVTLWLPHGLVRGLGAVAVIVAVVEMLLIFARRLGLVDGRETTGAPYAEEERGGS